MTAPVLHILFTDAGADVLRAALALAGRDDRVLTPEDDLSAGALSDARFETAFWAEALAPGPRRIVWTDRRVARQYAGLLAFVARAGEGDYAVVDLTHAAPSPLGQLAPEAAALLLDGSVPVSPDARADLAEDWVLLEAEDAPLRLIADGRLVSAPITAFDEAILDQCSPYWMRRALVMGMVLAEDGWRKVWNLSQAVVEARLDALVEAGLLEEGRGPKPDRGREIRLAGEIRQPD